MNATAPGATADVVIIGGGCVGTSVAFQLARRQAGKIILLERHTVGSGPTSKTSGFIRLHYSHDPLILLAARSLEMFAEFERLTGGTADFTRCGFLLLAAGEAFVTARVTVEAQQALGVRASILTAGEVSTLDPRMAVDDIDGAAYEPDAGYADGYATTASFAGAARRLGVEIWEETPVERITADDGGVRGVVTTRGSIETRTVLVAGGPWSPALLAPLGVDLPIRVTRHQVVHLSPPPGFGPVPFLCVDSGQGFYFRPETGGTVFLGMVDDQPEEIVPPDGFNSGVDFDFIERVGRCWRRRYPDASEAQVKGGFASVYDVTPDWQPVLGPVAEVPGLHLAAGFSGHGFKLSPALGEVLADTITGRHPSIDISAFNLGRFTTGRLIRGRHAQSILG